MNLTRAGLLCGGRVWVERKILNKDCQEAFKVNGGGRGLGGGH